VGTLIAIAVGGIVAALVMTVISETVKGQRAILDRDEAGEFSQYVRGILTSDSMCTKFLSGLSIESKKEADLILKGAGYGDQQEADIGKGFKFSGLELKELTYKRASENPVSMRVTLESPHGSKNYVNRIYRRFLVSVKMGIGGSEASAFYRPRFFDVPVFVDSDGKIEACNNEVSPADSCQAMGYRWDTASSPPSCVPDTACVFGGAYVITSAGSCKAPHVITETCQCPAGFKPLQTGAINVNMSDTVCKKGCDDRVLSHDTVVQCYKCPF
jgi:hypothetical protein